MVNPDDPDRQNAEEALECYLPRAVYALLTIINKLDSLVLPPERRRALLALLLTAFDEIPAPSGPIPPSGRARNSSPFHPASSKRTSGWPSSGASSLATAEKVPRVTRWPNLPTGAGGLCLFEGPLRNLAPYLKEVPLTAVVTVIPRPNQAYWILSYLWAGWLWGRQAALPFKAVLHRRRYDWGWHTHALASALKNLSEHLPLNVPLFALIPEVEPPFLSAVLLAAASAGFDLNGLAVRTHSTPSRPSGTARPSRRERREVSPIDPELVRQALLADLRERGEPATYLNLHAAGLESLAAGQSLQLQEESKNQNLNQALNETLEPIQAALQGPQFVHLGGSSNPETGLWALADWDPAGRSPCRTGWRCLSSVSSRKRPPAPCGTSKRP